MNCIAPTPYRAKQQGFSLLEVLVAIVVLSFGVLGVVGLQAASLQANKEARHQSAAARLGAELGDLMRGNMGVANLTSAALNPYLISNYPTTQPAAPTADCTSTATALPCAPTPLAQFQMTDWLQRVSAELPGAVVVVCFDTTPYDPTTGLPVWNCTPPGAAAANGAPPLVVLKMGWTRQSTNLAAANGSTTTPPLDRASITDANSHPAIVLPLNPGN
jgi:type IV pilus assembly protein PilV